MSGAPSAAALPPPTNPELERTLQRWNEATSRGDSSVLGELYADQLDLYGHLLKHDVALKKKLDAWRASPGFSQTIDHARFEPRANGEVQASFDKTSGVPGKQKTVRGYLLLRRSNSAWRVVDEGDHETNRVLKAKRDKFLASWGERFFVCPECTVEEGDPPQASPPFGPVESQAAVEPPPGAPSKISWAALYLERFASSVDVPTFVKMTPLSGNGDGRWFTFEVAGDGGKPREVLNCAAGGFWYEGPQPGKPDAAYSSSKTITSTEELRRDGEGIHFEKLLYAPDRIENHLSCLLDPAYEAYFMPIARRIASSMRIVGGGWYQRIAPDRAADATTPSLPDPKSN